MLLELASKEPVAERRRNSDQPAVIPEATSRQTSKRLNELFVETQTWQMRNCTN